ncbi:hypothetical protein [Achromobacter xylosoxidans]|uniref:Uncharacterized protein n=1 Tax=Achromobacter phage JWX TaxID=1589746 RepID=A0A0B5A4A8_9CAUD|nr:hypothetical protein [Achromobacter xylosoxidans]YP_009196218.1 hypothetical protein AVV28_gp33 [Achromobacter phage JWX]AJD82799.1 hypothetical protein JWX_00033 [Achromobacter phage JWX]WLW38452.1 hypothetical protein JWT_00028 [Achromobacter phage JWT]
MSNKINRALCRFGVKHPAVLERTYFWLMMSISVLAGVGFTLAMLGGKSIVDQERMQQVYDDSITAIRAEADARVKDANAKLDAILNRIPPNVVNSAVKGAGLGSKP